MTCNQGDFNGDGVVGLADLNEVMSNYGRGLPSGEPLAGTFPASPSLVAAISSVLSDHSPGMADSTLSMPVSPAIAFALPASAGRPAMAETVAGQRPNSRLLTSVRSAAFQQWESTGQFSLPAPASPAAIGQPTKPVSVAKSMAADASIALARQPAAFAAGDVGGCGRGGRFFAGCVGPEVVVNLGARRLGVRRGRGLARCEEGEATAYFL